MLGPPLDDVKNAIDRAVSYGTSLVGRPYGWWDGGRIPPGAPMWAAEGAPPDEITSVTCTGLTNLMLRAIGRLVPGEGGTLAYVQTFKRAGVMKKFAPGDDYPVCTLVLRGYRHRLDQGHVAVVVEGGKLLQSYADQLLGTAPGVTMDVALADSHHCSDGGRGYYEYAVDPADWLRGGQALAR